MEWAQDYICGEMRRFGYRCYRDIVMEAGEGRAEAEFERILDRLFGLPRIYGAAVLHTLSATRVIFEALRDYHKRTWNYKLYAVDRATYVLRRGLKTMSEWIPPPRPRLSKEFRLRTWTDIVRSMYER